jgi:hypothetical protein
LGGFLLFARVSPITLRTQPVMKKTVMTGKSRIATMRRRFRKHMSPKIKLAQERI